MNFIQKILDGFKHVGDWIVNGFSELFKFLAKPLSYLFYFLDGVFYFFYVLFDIVVKIIMIFVALFQFVFALIAGFLRTLFDLLTPSFNTGQVHLPSTSPQGFNVVISLVDPVGLLNIVPYILIAVVWGAFIMKILALFGGQVTAKGS
jgi:hypothetical protein